VLTRKQKSEMIEIVRDVAKAEILPRFRRLSDGAVSFKTSFDDLVTEADVASEKALTQRFQTLLPHAVIIGEEAVSEDESLLDQIDTNELVVIIDPIDGTWNFAHGLSTFGVLIAAIYQGETVYGLLYDPLNDDWIETSLGEGSWFVRPDQLPRRLMLSNQPVDSKLVGFFRLFCLRTVLCASVLLFSKLVMPALPICVVVAMNIEQWCRTVLISLLALNQKCGIMPQEFLPIRSRVAMSVCLMEVLINLLFVKA
jgi:hypothetical protein